MMKVRDALPVRRPNPTNNPTGENWSEHKKDLQEDFHFHCAYCGSYDGFRHTYFEVDHFVPKVIFAKNGNIGYCQYDNLVYSCKFCNNKKLSKWPSNDENIHNINDRGFVDPCKSEFDTHIYRTKNGGITWNTPLGEWMVKEAFKFDERDYSIKLLWELNQRRKLIEGFIIELSKRDKKSDVYKEIKREAEKLSFDYFVYHSELVNYYNSL